MVCSRRAGLLPFQVNRAAFVLSRSQAPERIEGLAGSRFANQVHPCEDKPPRRHLQIAIMFHDAARLSNSSRTLWGVADSELFNEGNDFRSSLEGACLRNRLHTGALNFSDGLVDFVRFSRRTPSNLSGRCQFLPRSRECCCMTIDKRLSCCHGSRLEYSQKETNCIQSIGSRAHIPLRSRRSGNLAELSHPSDSQSAT